MALKDWTEIVNDGHKKSVFFSTNLKNKKTLKILTLLDKEWTIVEQSKEHKKNNPLLAAKIKDLGTFKTKLGAFRYAKTYMRTH